MMRNLNLLSWSGLIALLVGWALLFWPTLVDMEQVWRGSDTYMHCYLVPLISLWLIREQPKLAPFTAPVQWWPLLLVIPVVAGWLLSFAADIALGSHLMAILTLQLLLISWLGRTLAWQLRFPIFYLLFMLPFGEEFNLPLQEITADITVYLLHAAGVPVFREGLYLATPVGHFEVAVACSGLRFLIASLAIGCIFAHLYFKTWYRQWLFMATMIVVSILANGARAFLLIWLAEVSDMQLGFGADHYIYGWLVFALVLALMFWLGLRFADKPQLAPQRQTSVSSVNQLPAGSAALLTMLAVIFVVFGWFSRTLPLQMPPQQPALLAPPSGFMATTKPDWDISFPASLRQGSARDSNGINWYRAEFAPRQTQGELINWNNQLFSPQRFTVLNQQQIQLPCGEAALLQLASNTGDNRTLLYWYQVENHCTTDKLLIKALQLKQLLSPTESHGAVVVLSLAGAGTNQNAQLQQAAHQIVGGVSQ